VKNSFIDQFSENIKFDYTSFDRVIIRGYILRLFSSACVVLFLRAMGFSRSTNGIMRIFTDQLNSHISRQAQSEFYFNGHNLKVTRKESYLIRTETTINNLEQGVNLIDQGLNQITGRAAEKLLAQRPSGAFLLLPGQGSKTN